MTNREYNRLRARQWRTNHPEEYKAYARSYYQKHKAEIQARRRAKRQENKPTD